MAVPNPIGRRPVHRQLTSGDPLGRGRAAMSRRTEGLRSRTAASAEDPVHTVGPRRGDVRQNPERKEPP
ncbi:hypothetical protein [Streptomyces sp. NPDC048496]|uniref:hypothetical protein n=1 Tax=Streptomyces sp. NPDC048496 TaxID=3365558 RepID=UPI00371A3325